MNPFNEYLKLNKKLDFFNILIKNEIAPPKLEALDFFKIKETFSLYNKNLNQDNYKTPSFKKLFRGLESQRGYVSPFMIPEPEPEVVDPWILARKAECTDVGFHDYSYKMPVLEPKEERSAPDFSALDPRKVLGLDKSETNPEKVTSRWRKLVIKHHPDKKGGSAEKFKKIQEAYETLIRELEAQPYDFTGMDAEAAVITARAQIKELESREERPHAHNVPILLESWKKLWLALSTFARTGEDREMEADLTKYQTLASENMKFWEFRKKLADISFDIPQEYQRSAFEVVNAKLDLLKHEFDLENHSGTWKPEICCHLRANIFFYDKRVALYRAQAEMAIQAGDNKTALAIRKKVTKIESKLDIIRINFIVAEELRAMDEAFRQTRRAPSTPVEPQESPKTQAEPCYTVSKNVRRLSSQKETIREPLGRPEQTGRMIVAHQRSDARPKAESRAKPEEKHVDEFEAVQKNLKKNFKFFLG